MDVQTSASTSGDNFNIFSISRMASIAFSSPGFPISIADLCYHIRNTPSSAAARMLNLIWYKETHGVRHEFLLIEVRDGDNTPVWLRLERAANMDHQSGLPFYQQLWRASQSMTSTFPANDTAIVSSSWKKISGTFDTRTIDHIALSPQATLGSLEKLLTAFCEVSESYILLDVSSVMTVECEFENK